MEVQPKLMRFSLADVPENEREVTLHEAFGRAVMNMDFQPLTEDPQVELECQFLPGAIITWGINTPHRVTSGYDASRENDDLALVWGSKGGLISQRGREVESNLGPALISCSECTSATTGLTNKNCTIRVQRSLLLSALPEAEALMMHQPFGLRNEPFRLLDGYLSLLRTMPPPDAELGHASAVHITDLIALAFGTGGDCGQIASGRGLRAARLALTKRWVLVNLSDPALCVTSAAIANGLSPRYVQILFAESGSTFSEFVLSTRLRSVHRCLCNRKLASRAISSIAYGAGFNDLSYFNRAFKATYGETPSDVRARALGDAEASSF